MTSTQWQAVITRIIIAALCFAMLAMLMIGDQLAQPETVQVPSIRWRLEHADS